MYSRAYVEVTNICNKSCSFCPGHERPAARMTAEQFRTVAEQISRVTKYVYYHVMGEPLTHPDICELIRIASGAGLRSALTTNGSLLGKCGDGLIESGVYKVNISVHSFEGESGAEYEKYIFDCLDFADRASEAGVLCVLRLWNRGYDGGRNEDIILKARRKFPDGEWKEGARGIRIRHKLHVEYGDRFDWPDMEAEDCGANVFCYGLRDHFGVLCDGTVVPCCLDRNGDLKLGNVFSEDIEDILSSDRAKAILGGFDNRNAVEELCRKCGYARRFR